MSKKKNEISFLIIYKDHSYSKIKASKINHSKLCRDDIKMILVPSTDRDNVYIPLKPSALYNFKSARVQIIHNVFAFEMENVQGDELSSILYSAECHNLIELGNALFNLYKFRGTSIFLSEKIDLDSGITLTFTDYPIRIMISFYDEDDHEFYKIDSGIMSQFSTHKLERFLAYPPQYCFEDRFNCVNDLMFAPIMIPYNSTDSETNGLPMVLALRGKKWKKIHKFNNDSLRKGDILLQKLPDYECYYMISMDLYFQLDDSGASSIYVKMGSVPVVHPYDPDYFPTLKRTGKIIRSEKEYFYQDLLDGNCFSIFPITFDMENMKTFLTVYAFLPIMMNYMKYFTNLSYNLEVPEYQNSNGMDIYNFVVFDTHIDARFAEGKNILMEQELTPESLDRAIIKTIK